jgi:hypothetical protein
VGGMLWQLGLQDSCLKGSPYDAPHRAGRITDEFGPGIHSLSGLAPVNGLASPRAGGVLMGGSRFKIGSDPDPP